jgi:hypothetical protein
VPCLYERAIGDANYSFFGGAHIRGSNIVAGEYEQEAIYDGAVPLLLGRVVGSPSTLTIRKADRWVWCRQAPTMPMPTSGS